MNRSSGLILFRRCPNKVLPEKEARVIAAQVAAGLAYINGPRHRIIHYDLKPANILFNQYGEVKITVRSLHMHGNSPDDAVAVAASVHLCILDRSVSCFVIGTLHCCYLNVASGAYRTLG